jgi:hypothetical protein
MAGDQGAGHHDLADRGVVQGAVRQHPHGQGDRDTALISSADMTGLPGRLASHKETTYSRLTRHGYPSGTVPVPAAGGPACPARTPLGSDT